MRDTPLSLAVLASGVGTNLQAIVDAIDAGRLDAQVRIVISNRADSGAMECARRQEIPTLHLDPDAFSEPTTYPQRLLEALAENQTELLVMAGYMKRVPIPVIQAYRNRAINVHPALLPAFGGKGMYGKHVHEAVIAAGVRVTGVTVHFADEVYDHGPIIAQQATPVYDDDTPATLAARVQSVEHILYPLVIQWFAEGRVRVDGRRVRVMP